MFAGPDHSGGGATARARAAALRARLEARSVIRPGEATRFWFAAAFLAVAAHALWFSGLEPRRVTDRRVSRALPVFAFVSPAGPIAARTGGSANPWSPTWFAFPSEHGFSRPALQAGFVFRPPLSLPFSAALLLARPEAAPAAVIEPETLRAVMGVHDIPSVPPPRTAFVASGVKMPAAIRVEFSGGLRESRPEAVRWPEELTRAGQGPWHVEAALEVAPAGWVRAVLLSEADISAASRHTLLRSLYALRFPPASAPRDGLVTLRFPGLVAAYPAAAGKKQP